MVVTRSLLRLSRFAVAAVAASLIVSAGDVRGQSAAADQTVARSATTSSSTTRARRASSPMKRSRFSGSNATWSLDGFARRLVYELRVEWNPSVEGDESPATVTRQLLTVNGKPPRKGDEPEVHGSASVSPEPLAFLLPDRRHKYAFTGAGIGRVDGRDALMVDYRSARGGQADGRVDRRVRRASMTCPADGVAGCGPIRETAAIVRLDEQLIGMVDLPIPRKHQRVNGALYMTLERREHVDPLSVR